MYKIVGYVSRKQSKHPLESVEGYRNTGVKGAFLCTVCPIRFPAPYQGRKAEQNKNKIYW